jgi:hypothetical protein
MIKRPLRLGLKTQVQVYMELKVGGQERQLTGHTCSWLDMCGVKKVGSQQKKFGEYHCKHAE